MDPVCRIELLGGLRVHQEGRNITRFRTHKTAALLAYLAFYLGQQHPREVLVEHVWPELNLPSGRNNLSTALSSLRNQLEPPGIPSGAVLVTDRHSVGLNTDVITTDVSGFEAALRAAAEGPSGALQAQYLEQALALYRGPLLPGFYEAWIATEQERLAERFSEAAARWIGYLKAHGDLNGAIDAARRAAAVDPLREERHRDLLRLLLATGQIEAARRHYAKMEETLADEPSPATRALLDQIKSQLSPLPLSRELNAASSSSQQSAAIRQHSHIAIAAQNILPDQATLPSGTVTFLLTQIDAPNMPCEDIAAMPTYKQAYRMARETIVATGGHVVIEDGTSPILHAAFSSAGAALSCALNLQRAFFAPPFTPSSATASGLPVVIRLALHTADAKPAAMTRVVPATNGELLYPMEVVDRAVRTLKMAIHGEILCSEATAALLVQNPLAGIRLAQTNRSLDLDGVPEPLRIFVVAQDGKTPATLPEPTALATVETAERITPNIPRAFNPFFGRETEIRQIREVLSSTDVDGTATAAGPLLILMGPGGVGKTRLAREAAEGLIPHCSGAVWFVPLGHLRNPNLLFGSIADSMRLPRNPDREPLEQIVEALSGSEGNGGQRRSPLLVLDGFDMLVDCGGPEALQQLRARVPGLACLITSRRVLGLPGEQEMSITPLPAPSASRETFAVAGEETQTPEALLSQYASIALFVSRAQAVRPDFQITPSNAVAIAALVRRLEGIPLAIELAAARAQVMAPAQMLEQLEQRRFDFLRASPRRSRGVPERHQSLRAAMEWSYHLLTPDLQQLFVRLSVFRAGCTAEAATVVCVDKAEHLPIGSAVPMNDRLGGLCDCSLVRAEEQGASGVRFTLLDTLREFGWAQLADDERAVLQRRLAHHFLTLAEEMAPKLQGAEQAGLFDVLELEHDNIRAVLDWCRETPGAAETGLRIAASLYLFWDVRGHIAEGRRRLTELLALPEAVMPTEHRAQALARAGILAFSQNDWDTAREAYRESLEIRRGLGNEKGVATLLNNLANVATCRNDYVAARELLEESLEIRRRLGDKHGTAGCLINLLAVPKPDAGPETERIMAAEAVSIMRDLNDRRGLASALINSGIVWIGWDRVKAKELFDEALALFREIGDVRSSAVALLELGTLALHDGEYSTATDYFEQTLTISRNLEDQHTVAVALENLGAAAGLQGELAAMRGFLAEGASLATQLGDNRILIDILEDSGRVAHSFGYRDRAARLFGAAAALRERIGLLLPPYSPDEANPLVALIHTVQSDPEYTSAWSAGHALSAKAAITEALEPDGT